MSDQPELAPRYANDSEPRRLSRQEGRMLRLLRHRLGWHAPHELAAMFVDHYDIVHDGSGITACLRRLRSKGHDVECRKRAGSDSCHEYRLVK